MINQGFSVDYPPGMCYNIKYEGENVSEIKIDWEGRNRPITPADLEKIRLIKIKYNISDEEWDDAEGNISEQNNIISSTAPETV